MKRDTIRPLQKSFDKNNDAIYLGGPFFNEQQESWAIYLAYQLRERGFKVYAPVDEKWEEGSKKTANEIFIRNLQWMLHSKMMLAQMDYPIEPPNVLALVNTNDWLYETINMPDSGTVWEMGYMYAQGKPVIGYTAKPVSQINLMLSECLDGFCFETPLDVFTVEGINWNLIKPWKGVPK